MIDPCPMTEACPGFDREARVCLIRTDDCEFATSRADADATPAPGPRDATRPASSPAADSPAT